MVERRGNGCSGVAVRAFLGETAELTALEAGLKAGAKWYDCFRELHFLWSMLKSSPGECRAAFLREQNRKGRERENAVRLERGASGASRVNQDRSPFDLQSCPGGISPLRQPRPVADDEGRRRVEADGLAVVGPLLGEGCRRPVLRHPAEKGSQANIGEEGRGTGRDRDAAAGARQPLDATGAGAEAGGRRLDGVRHPVAQRTSDPQNMESAS